MTDGIVKIIGVPITQDKTFDELLNLRPNVKACPDEADFTYELDNSTTEPSDDLPTQLGNEVQ